MTTEENIFIDGDFNEGYESRVRASTGKNTLIPKEELAQLRADKAELLDALKVIKDQAAGTDYRGLATYKLCTDLLAKHSHK